MLKWTIMNTLTQWFTWKPNAGENHDNKCFYINLLIYKLVCRLRPLCLWAPTHTSQAPIYWKLLLPNFVGFNLLEAPTPTTDNNLKLHLWIVAWSTWWWIQCVLKSENMFFPFMSAFIPASINSSSIFLFLYSDKCIYQIKNLNIYFLCYILTSLIYSIFSLFTSNLKMK